MTTTDGSDASGVEQWATFAAAPNAESLFEEHAFSAYCLAWPDNMLVTFPSGPATLLFDALDMDGGREARTVAAWGRVPTEVESRDRQRHAGYPMSQEITDAGYDKGHLIARATGGGYDANIFAQAWQINQGRSPEGKRFRRLERLAAANPDALFVARLLYSDDTAIPFAVHLLVAVPGQPVEQEVFTNQPIPRPSRAASIARMQAGTAFHLAIQTAFVAELVGATGDPERDIPLAGGRTGRIDLLVVPVGDERLAVVVEIKNTDWDALASSRIRPNFRRHVRQLHGYLDTIIGRIGEPNGWDSAMGVLLYRTPPAADQTRRILDEGAQSEGFQVVYASETAWAQTDTASSTTADEKRGPSGTR